MPESHAASATSATSAVLALDQGGHASRACVVSRSGEILAQAVVPVGTRQGPAGEVEQDADELVESLRAAARSALRQARARGEALRIDAAGLATQRSTVVCFDRRDGSALSPAISWQDRRNAAWLAGFMPQAVRIQRITGLTLSPHYGVAKMRWCLDELPAVQAARSRGVLQLAPLASFLAARLTGEAARVDPANAARTLLWDSARHDWSEELLALFGIERSLLPACTRTRADFGRLLRMGDDDARADQADSSSSARGARRSDGSAVDGIALRAVTGDQSAVPFAFGAPDVRAVYVNLGTGAFLQRPIARRPTAASPLLASVLALEPRSAWYSVEGTVNGAGSAISAFCEQERCEQAPLWPALEQLPSAGELPIYINGIGGLGSPYWRPAQRSYFLGEGTLIERFAAVLESVVFLVATNFECMRRWGGPPEHVLLSGGLSACDWLCRRLSACLGVPLLRGAQEATVLGIASLAARRAAGRHAGQSPTPSQLRRFAPQELPPAARARLLARRVRFDAGLRART